MRRLSSVAQVRLIEGSHARPMTIHDPLLPAVGPLTGAGALEVLLPAVTAAGGTLHTSSPTQVHYVPGRELVVRYDCEVTWGARRGRDTILAATTLQGYLPGAVPVAAETADETLEVSVWRWPFDPVVTGLALAVTPASLTKHLDGVLDGPLAVEVVAYRPTERAVVRVTDRHGEAFFLKVLPPDAVDAIAERHRRLRAVGVPAPRVVFTDPGHGFVLIESVNGATLRDRIKRGDAVWPEPVAIADMLDRLATVTIEGAEWGGRATRTHDAPAHARMLASILPGRRDTLAELERLFAGEFTSVERRRGRVVHGDLHESQLFCDDGGALVGLIDFDDLGPGDPLDDPAVLLGHLEYRALTTSDPSVAATLGPRIAELRRHFGERHDIRALDLTVAAVLVGLATGPFRACAPEWEQLTVAVLDAAHRRAFDRNAT